MRIVLTAANDKSWPPSELHIVDGAESGNELRIEKGSLDFPIDEQAQQALADMLAARGVRPSR